MKKLINDPARVVDEVVEGLALSDDRLMLLPDETVVVRADHGELRQAGKVAILSGGGSGHEPAHAGYVGPGMLTGAIAGAVFTSPSVDAVAKAILTVGGPAGVLLIIKNYTGDKLNFGLAAEIARTHGIPVEMVVVGDDVALGDGNVDVGRRGIAGTIFVHKVAGAAAEAGLSLEEVREEAQAAADNLATMGIGLSPCTVPAAGKPGFELGEDEVEFGLGIHGESGVRKGKIAPADEMFGEILSQIINHGGFKRGDAAALMVNGLGGTPALELAIVSRFALRRLAELGIDVRAAMSGTFMSALEMAGCSISLLRLDDTRTARLLSPSSASGWSQPTVPVAAAKRSAPIDLGADEALRGPAWGSDGSKAAFAKAIHAITTELRAAEAELTRLDNAVGDGDLGISMTRGSDAVEAVFDTLDLDHPARALEQISSILRRWLAGTSGPLYSMLTLRAASSLAGEASVDDPAAWGRALKAGCEGIMQLGGASPGDRTMLDALVPAAEAFAAAEGDIGARIAAMHQAALAGVEATKSMQPKRGRSTYMGDRTAGHPDPGAVAVTVWMGALKGT